MLRVVEPSATPRHAPLMHVWLWVVSVFGNIEYIPSTKAQNGPAHPYDMVFGPKTLKTKDLGDLGFILETPHCVLPRTPVRNPLGRQRSMHNDELRRLQHIPSDFLWALGMVPYLL